MKARSGHGQKEDSGEDVVPATSLLLLQQKLPKQTLRWCQTSSTLFSLIVLESPRIATYSSLVQFLDVIFWRAHDKITAEEFSVLFAEWMQLPAHSVLAEGKSPLASPSNNAAASKRKTVVTVGVFRAVLLEKNFSESDVDLFIGIVLNEFNHKFLHATIAYQPSVKGVAKGVSSAGLEVVTHRWLALSEELFFALDTPGTEIRRS